jgi:hypothetical protein
LWLLNVQRAQIGTRTVVAAILGCRRAGASSPAETGVHCKHRVSLGQDSFLPGGWEARPLRQAGMPDATTVRVPGCAHVQRVPHRQLPHAAVIVRHVNTPAQFTRKAFQSLEVLI